MNMAEIFMAIAAWCGDVSSGPKYYDNLRTHATVQTCRESLIKCLGLEEYNVTSTNIKKCFKAEVFR